MNKLEITIKQLSDANVNDYEKLAKFGDDGKLCYCSFWHQKFASMAEYDQLKKTDPDRLKACVIERMKAQFHVGVVAYVDGVPCAWISVGPLTDFYWSWRRVAQVGEAAKSIAGIMCFTLAPEFRGQKMQPQVLEALKSYGASQGWKAIEAYPFSDAAIEKHGIALMWPGVTKGYERAGFKRIENHWLSSPEAERSIYKFDL